MLVVRWTLCINTIQYIYLINQARGPYCENIGPRSWQYGPIQYIYLINQARGPYCENIGPRSWQYGPIQYIYLINQARGPYSENTGSRSWQYGLSAARSVQKRPRANTCILPVRSRASLVDKRFIARLKNAKTAKTQVRDHSGKCPVQYSLSIEHFDWLILVIVPLTAWVV